MKFGNLLKKELGELITKQAVISMVFVLVLFVFMGQIMGHSMEEGFDTSTLNICIRDDSDFTKNVIERIKTDAATELNIVDIQSDNYYDELERLDLKYVVIIPEGYGDTIVDEKKPGQLIFASKVSLGFSAAMSSISSSDAVSTIIDHSADEAMESIYGLTAEDVELLTSPANTVEFSAANGKSVEISAAAVSSIVMMESMIAPFAIFFLLLLASQMIMTAISTEKIDKTLETLLSTPVSRMTVLTAKMVAAIISALLNAVFMIIGFGIYMVSIMGGAMSGAAAGSEVINMPDAGAFTDVLSTADAISQLGFSLSGADILLFGLQLFLTLAIGLSISLILGATATDVKSVQTLVMPIMIAVMIPFFVTMFMDFGEMPVAAKVIMFLIPFTHSYIALTNLMSGDMIMYWGGLAYQIVFFAVCMFLAVRMFTSDKLFTMSFSTENKTNKKLLKK
ncbi:MAG: ABC transporter permease [Oscillospiraceae bacterium]|nr:ABC transporter permease [Oscillospiraceae bacterium]